MQHNICVTLPNDMAMRIINGERPVRVWRDHRGLTASTLADKAKISKTYLSESESESEIENGKKPGSVEAYKAINEALDVPLDAVVP